MNDESEELRALIVNMREAFSKGQNAMAYARNANKKGINSLLSTLIAYDLQAGSYTDITRRHQDYMSRWCGQIADLLVPYINDGDSILEVGVGEATTLTGVISAFSNFSLHPLGCDISWSRIKVANDWVKEHGVYSKLFVGDLFSIPLANNSVDVIYTSHSLEPNGGKELPALTELLRVARKAVVLVEPIYELAGDEAKKRMIENGYVRNLKSTSESLGAKVTEYGLLEVVSNKLNPSGVVLLEKPEVSRTTPTYQFTNWQCPMTKVELIECSEYYLSKNMGIVYPILKGIPLLRAEHAVVASLID